MTSYSATVDAFLIYTEILQNWVSLHINSNFLMAGLVLRTHFHHQNGSLEAEKTLDLPCAPIDPSISSKTQQQTALLLLVYVLVLLGLSEAMQRCAFFNI
jgi:hypothetical protein